MAIMKELSKDVDCSLILEEDGSTDNTRKIIKEMERNKPNIYSRCHDKRLGKGGGLIFGIEDLTTDYVLITDADLPVRVEDYVNLHKEIMKGNDIVIVNRRHEKSTSDLPFSRRFVSLGFNLYVRGFFMLGIQDTQCGVKIFKTSSPKQIIPKHAKRYAMDVEILYRAKKKKMKICDIPVKYTRGRDTNPTLTLNSARLFNFSI